jgi:hypothetical protein
MKTNRHVTNMRFLRVMPEMLIQFLNIVLEKYGLFFS